MAIYDEAVVDAQKLRSVAEEAAKQQILEAITPRIRKMINSRILSEQVEPDDQDGEDEDLELDDDSAELDGGDETSGLDSDDLGSVDFGSDDLDSEDTDSDDFDTDDFDTDDSEDYDVDFSLLDDGMPSGGMGGSATMQTPPSVSSSDKKGSSFVINNTGDIHIKSESFKGKSSKDRLLEALKNKKINETYDKKITSRVNALSSNIVKFRLVLEALSHVKATPAQKRQIKETYHRLTNEAISLRSEIFAGGGGSQRLERKLISTLKEMKEMSNKTKRNIFDFLFEGEDKRAVSRKGARKLFEADKDEDEDLDLDADAGEDMGDDMGGDEDKTDKVKDALSSLLSALEMDDLEVTKKDGEDAAGDEDLDMGAPDEDGGDDLDLEETYDESADEGYMSEMYNEEMYEADEGLDEADEADEGLDEADEADEGLDEADEADEGMDEVFEISESDLRRELGKMKSLRENKARQLARSRTRTLREEADPKADQFGGGKVLGDVFEMDEDDLINVLVDELGTVKQKPRPPKAHESIAARRAMQEAAQYKKAAEGLKSQLVEMNLFNAKLLYANKLMQNKDLTLKQQRAIVEALDNAKTLNEAKLLYKSLSESLARRGQSSGNLSESATRTLGSSSRSTRSAQPANNGVGVDRWAVLAGIPK